jgi:hypothetical protein
MRYRKNKDTKALILFITFCLSTFSSITGINMTSYSGGYFLGFWFVICAIAVSGADLTSIVQNFSSLKQKAIVSGVLLSLILSPNIISVAWYKRNDFSSDKKEISQLIEYCVDDTSFVILPYHPIFAYDATKLYSYWQLYYAGDFPEIRSEIMNQGVYNQVKRLRPAVVLCSLERKNFLLELFQKELISKGDYKKLASFFEANYTIKRIGKNRYYIRNDLL